MTAAARTLDSRTRLLAMLAAALAALPLLRLLPGWLALSLTGIGALAVLSSHVRPWPAALRLLLTLSLAGLVLAAFGFRFGRDTGSALLLAMLAMKLTESASLRDLRSLIGFALFALFAAFLQDQGPVTLLLALCGLTAVIAVLGRLAEFEAGLAPAARPSRYLRQALLWLGLALPLALAGFWFYPRLSAPLWGVPENAMARTGISERMAPGDWLDLLVDDRPAFRARFFGPEPERTELYWRGPVLWHFDGRAWTRPAWVALRPPGELLDARRIRDYEITLEPSDRRFLFALDLPLEAPEGGRLSVDLSPYAEEPVRALRRYRMRAVEVERFQPELPAMVRNVALGLPSGYNPRTLTLARQWHAEADSDLAYIERVLAWFKREFSYTLAAPPLGRHTADEFLFDTRIGFCEHYSSAFVVLMRAAGIPARVVTGYVGGYRNPFGDYWLIQQSDAHAWAEVWLPERGWLRVDPTAAVDPSRVFERYGNRTPTGGLADGLIVMAGTLDWLRQGWNRLMLGFDASRQRMLLRPFGIPEAERWQLLTVFAGAAALAIAFVLWGLGRQALRAPRDPLDDAWRRLCRRMARRGLGKRPDETALSFAERVATDLAPESAESLRSVSRGFVVLRYAEPQHDGSDRSRLIARIKAFKPQLP